MPEELVHFVSINLVINERQTLLQSDYLRPSRNAHKGSENSDDLDDQSR